MVFNRALFTLLLGIVFMDMNSAQRHVSLVQTEGYKDTWTNMNSTCSLLGTRLNGSLLENKVKLDNINYISRTGWIAAHIKRDGTMRFDGCVYGTEQYWNSGLKILHDRIPECLYFCGSNDILFHQNHCYCTRNVHLENTSCIASLCGNNEALFCGQSSKCMCRYRQHILSNIGNILKDNSCQTKQRNCTLTAYYATTLSIVWNWHVRCMNNHVQCDFDWNGYVMREMYYWGTSSSSIGNEDYCVAIRKVNPTKELKPITLRCSSKQTGICIQGSRISTTPQTTQQSTVLLPTTPGYELHSSEMVSYKVSEHTTNGLKTNPDSTLDYDTNTPPDTNTLLHTNIVPDTNILPHTTTLPDTNAKPDATTMVTRIKSTSGKAGFTSAKSSKSSNKSTQKEQTNILRPILGGVGAFVVFVIAGVSIVIIVKKRRRNADARSKPSHELKTLSSSKRHQNQYVNRDTEHQGGGQQNHTLDNEKYDSPTTSRTKSENAVFGLYDHTSGAGDNMYGRLNQNGRGNVSPETADIYDHSRAVVQVNGDTYDSFQTGVSREDCSADYYDHTPVGEDYGYLEKGGNRNDQVDDIYDHARGNGRVDGGTYDTFQEGRGRDDASEDCYDHTGASAEYGYLQKGSKATVLGVSDYDTMNIVTEDV